ncbi:hypothetical protein C9J03_06135 [Photobacterium gaetbulicola]|uniref:Uncharacterized protein n=1 Tax=Photobacterium gaetbulicola Gung47 TaxID=658445 RepID=A0A0C5WRF9_9GAMM|nr:hypothetical protein [Photobacterium gaetbulicola]AJR08937.1 hypothetical protein H744_2c2274 [Photobacterium gaetbulicola Gung47]PSU13492.1 hypothetical protein C9J03_06135 [Photobacterium gaetbulicola]
MHNSKTRTQQQANTVLNLMKYALPLMLVTLFAFSPASKASDAATDTVANQKEVTHRINAIQRDLASIRQQTLQANPELIEQAKAFETAYQAKAKEIGYNPDEFINQAQEIQDKVRNAETSEEEREALIKEFAAAKRQLAEQRESLLADESLMAMQEKLQSDTYAAMKAFDPKTERLVDELNTLLESL